MFRCSGRLDATLPTLPTLPTEKSRNHRAWDHVLHHQLSTGNPNFYEQAALAKFTKSPKTSQQAFSKAEETRWFVVYCAPKFEARVCNAATHIGFSGYSPVTRSWQRQSRREVHQKRPRVSISRPLMTRYALIELPVTMVEGRSDVPFGALSGIDGVQAIIGNAFGPIAISEEIVEAIRAREDAGEWDETATRSLGKSKAFRSPSKERKSASVTVPKWIDFGTSARILSGPFEDFEGLIREILPNDQIKVEIDIFGRPTLIQVDLADIDEA